MSEPKATIRNWWKLHSTRILAMRVLLVGSLIAAAVVSSVVSYTKLQSYQYDLFQSSFQSTATNSLDVIDRQFTRMNVGLQQLSSIYSHAFPDVDSWPTVKLNGFYDVATPLEQLTSLASIAFLPIVTNVTRAKYEQFIWEYFMHDSHISRPLKLYSHLSNGTIWKLNMTTLTPIEDRTGYSQNSPYTLMTPVAQATFSSVVDQNILGYNLHFDPRFSNAVDDSYECVLKELSAGGQSSFSDCGSFSDAVTTPFPSQDDPVPIPTDIMSLILRPVFPANNSTNITGFVAGAVSWKAVVGSAFSDHGSVDVVLNIGSSYYTFRVIDGTPVYMGHGDHHDRGYDHLGRHQILSLANATEVTAYSIHVYPRQDFEAQYTDNQPIMAVIKFLAYFMGCTTLFLVYDVLMKREFSRKQAILDTKRRYVRFISHEIRSPLNTVILGLQLFEAELNSIRKKMHGNRAESLPKIVSQAIKSMKQLSIDMLHNTESAVEVLNDLLNYDKIEMGTLRLEIGLFNIWDLVTKTVTVMRIEAKHKNIHLELYTDHQEMSARYNAVPVAESSSSLIAQNLELGTKLSQRVVIGDSNRISQVLRNLVTNALKFTPVGGNVTVSVRTDFPASSMMVHSDSTQHVLSSALEQLQSQSRRTGSIFIAVKDTGAGLTEQQLREICREGVQFNANELQAGQGSGLGLFISKGIVEQHGGHLLVSSEGLGKGVTFTIELPLYQVSAAENNNVFMSSGNADERSGRSCGELSNAGALSARVPLYDSGGNGNGNGNGDRSPDEEDDRDVFGDEYSSDLPKGGTLLVVDDSMLNRKMLVKLLESKGYICEQAEDGEKAVQMYANISMHRPVLAVIMDSEMPVLNGPGAAKKLREMGCNCAIVGVTGNLLPDDIAHYKKCGADIVLPKPLRIDEFEAVLRAKECNKPVRSERTVYTASRESSREEAASNRTIIPLIGSPSSSSKPSSSKVYAIDSNDDIASLCV